MATRARTQSSTIAPAASEDDDDNAQVAEAEEDDRLRSRPVPERFRKTSHLPNQNTLAGRAEKGLQSKPEAYLATYASFGFTPNASKAG